MSVRFFNAVTQWQKHFKILNIIHTTKVLYCIAWTYIKILIPFSLHNPSAPKPFLKRGNKNPDIFRRQAFYFFVAKFVPTRKGSLLLVYNGYAFRLKNKLAYGKKQWYCTSRRKTGCQVDVITAIHRKGSMIKRIRDMHNHPAPGFYRSFDGSYRVV